MKKNWIKVGHFINVLYSNFSLNKISQNAAKKHVKEPSQKNKSLTKFFEEFAGIAKNNLAHTFTNWLIHKLESNLHMYQQSAPTKFLAVNFTMGRYFTYKPISRSQLFCNMS